MADGRRELMVTYKHSFNKVQQQQTGRLARLFFIDFRVDASTSVSLYQKTIADLTNQLPELIREEMKAQGLDEILQSRILLGISSFADPTLFDRNLLDDMQNVEQLLPYTLLSEIKSSSRTGTYKPYGTTPLADTMFLAGKIASDAGYQLSLTGAQTFGLTVILTDGQDSDFASTELDGGSRVTNYYATPELAKQALEDASEDLMGHRTLLFGIGSSQSDKREIALLAERVGIARENYYDAGRLSEVQIKNFVTFLVKFLVFQADQLLLQGATMLALPPASTGQQYGIVPFKG